MHRNFCMVVEELSGILIAQRSIAASDTLESSTAEIALPLDDASMAGRRSFFSPKEECGDGFDDLTGVLQC